MSVTVRAAAKINLHLGVGAPREDGFHPLDTVYQAISLYDDLTLVAADPFLAGADPSLAGADPFLAGADSSQIALETTGYVDAAAVPLGADNIISKALDAIRSRTRCGGHERIELAKSIPVAGGMAGGSADAAAALVAHDRLHSCNLPDDALLQLAADLGSDVPFSLVGGTARGRGRGEVVESLADDGTWWWVAVPSGAGLSTPEVYRHYDRLFPDAPVEPAPADSLLAALASGEPLRLARTMHNDLQAPAVDLRPELGTLIARGETEGALRGMVSGSGPTCVFLCDSQDGASAVMEGLQGAGHAVVLVTNGPVAGAHVVEGPLV